MSVRQRSAPVRNPRHLAFIRSQPCAADGCRTRPVEAHHLRVGTDGGMGLKPSDTWAIPLCRVHHAEIHRLGEQVFERQIGIGLRALAAELATLSKGGPMP